MSMDIPTVTHRCRRMQSPTARGAEFRSVTLARPAYVTTSVSGGAFVGERVEHGGGSGDVDHSPQLVECCRTTWRRGYQAAGQESEMRLCNLSMTRSPVIWSSGVPAA